MAKLSGLFRESRSTVVFTGAGVSTESGLPDFRSRTGLWQGVDPMALASIEAWRRRPNEFFTFYRQRLSGLQGARPNHAHLILARLEAAGMVRAILTQNIDGLHQEAGHRSVIELHGSLRQALCLACDRRYASEILLENDLPSCKACGKPLKPDVVLFGEALPAAAWDLAVRESCSCDLFVVVGSSLAVSPANHLPALALEHGSKLAIVNLERTHLDPQASVVVSSPAGEVFIELSRELLSEATA
ncbi:MAG: NAD-dependent deacylase [Firmicutes bacterium]|nr:NAD-dependent deacylase [Bacillota bacterium]